MGKLFLRPTRRDAVVALMSMMCVLLFTRMFDMTLQDVASPHFSHEAPDLLSPSSKAKAKPTYKAPKVQQHDDVPGPAPVPVIPKRVSWDGHDAVHNPVQHTVATHKSPSWPNLSAGLPKTKLVKHGAGWTIFENIYMSNGTMFIVTDDDPSLWPARRMMTDTGITALNTPENIAAREPTKYELDWITPKQAEEMWGVRIWSVPDFTLLWWDPLQFINHYYHFAAELLMGTWRMLASYDSHINVRGEYTSIPTPARAIFPHVEPRVWRDGPKFNQFFLHSVWPGIGMEFNDAWEDRVALTKSSTPDAPGNPTPHAFLYQTLLLADRSASFRGQHCSINARTVSEAVEATRKDLEDGPGKDKGKWWWEPVRRRVMKMAGVNAAVQDISLWWYGADEDVKKLQSGLEGGRPTVVITYISRQTAGRRKLVQADHEVLVQSLKDLVARKNAEGIRPWHLEIVEAEHLSREEQVRLAARTTVMLGVHGNGLTHLLLMPLSPLSTVIEMFIPGGFARDYQWTSTALGMRHYGIHNDTAFTEPSLPWVEYPEGFQGNAIPVHGPFVAKLIEERIDGASTVH
ncbi:hypothetical protein RhiJN_10764 [Ceratobasidium sp. AG-Ba]|nr:hypothetical protein RhiJN_10764 [Ceratobasidium sp. AG-Ba]